MWSKNSWVHYSSQQLPVYDNGNQLAKVKSKLSSLAPLVATSDIDNLKQQLINAENGKSFILQVGECAESLKNIANYNYISAYYSLIQEAQNILSEHLNKPVITIGRIAGQFAKPRTTLFETQNNCSLNSFRGEIINGVNFTPKERTPNPCRMLLAYCSSKQALAHIATNINNAVISSEMQQYETINNKYLFTSHEALLLDYEECLTKKVNGIYYNVGAHMLWVGARTNNLHDPHLEYLRGIENPVGIKIHPKMDIEQLIGIINVLNPSNKEGRIVLIVRLGVENINTLLAKFIKIVQKNQLRVNWLVDPMHGNTKELGGVKTRLFDDIWAEIKQFITIIKQFKIKGYGLHLEIANSLVTECIGGVENPILEENLNKNYLTLCDPRLNSKQALEIIRLTASAIK